MIFNIPLSSIKYEDVVRFCETGVEENSVLEYKGSFPENQNLAKTVGAFANTYGGTLILGVSATKGKPTPPFTGIQLDPKVSERIEAIVLGNLTEPVFPEIQVCMAPSKDLGFVVIRVAESPNAPHRFDNRRVYIRTGQSSTPTDEADWERTQWLASRRQKSLQLKAALIQGAEKQYENALHVRTVDVGDRNAYFANLSLRCCPSFPQAPITDFDRLESLLSTIQVKAVNNVVFPEMTDNYLRAIQNGIQGIRFYEHRLGQPEHGKPFFYISASRYGVLVYKQPLGSVFQDNRMMDAFDVARNVTFFLGSAAKFFKSCGFFGNLDFDLELRDVHGVKLENPGPPPRADEKTLTIEADDIRTSRSIIAHQLWDRRHETAASMLYEVMWAFGARRTTEAGILKQLIANLITE